MVAQGIEQWETRAAEDVARGMETDVTQGLSHAEARKRLRRFGPNALTKKKDFGLLGRIFSQFKSPLVYILLAAGTVTLFLHEYLDAIVIFSVLVINVIVGTFQEERASRAFDKLNASKENTTTVIRGGQRTVIPTEEVVPGDLIVLLGGSHVSADVRLVEAKNLSINEAALTGEWVSVSKDEGVLDKSLPLAERFNMAWMGTLVSAGYGLGIAIATGDKTQVGAIAESLTTVEDRVTPLQRNIRKVARFLVVVIVIAIAAIFVLGLVRGEPFVDMLLISIAVAVAAIPSGLPAAVTIVLALGMEAILKRGGLVRNLLAAETLGATTIILTDKTGTLTEAKMRLAEIYTRNSPDDNTADRWTAEDRDVLKMGVLASDAFIEETDDVPKKIHVHGRPIERAIVLAGLEIGITQDELKDDRARVDFLQFESRRRFGASLNQYGEKKNRRLYLTGAPEFLLERAQYVHVEGAKRALTDEDREHFTSVQEQKSADGMRFIGVAYKDVLWDTMPKNVDSSDSGELLKDTVFAGFLVFNDPIRVGVGESIQKVTDAGAHVIMLTGDNPQTAFKIAREVGIAGDNDIVRRGDDIEKKNDAEVLRIVRETKVFARVLPAQKLRIARVLKSHDEVVAMTGDGVNDAPALRAANIGVAVGSGTEVAKEASDLILLNNSFSIIVAAIEEGRRIIDNLKKIVSYLLSTSFTEIVLIGSALAAAAPLPLLPTQILWAKMVEEGLMSFPFAFEKKEKDIMKRDPRSLRMKNILTPEVKRLIFTVGAITGVLLVALYFFLLQIDLPIEKVRTIMFIALSLDSIFFTFSFKSFQQPIWKIDIFSNVLLVAAFVASVLLLVAALSLGPLQTLLSLVPLSFGEVALLFGVGLINLATIEMSKYFLFRKNRRN